MIAITKKPKLTNVEKVRQYDLKNGNTTARQAASDLDLTPQQVYQIRYQLSKKAKKIEVPKEWEEDAQQMAEAIKTAPVEKAPELRVTMREATALADQNVELSLKNTQLNVELARAKIIINYLEKRVEDLSVRR